MPGRVAFALAFALLASCGARTPLEGLESEGSMDASAPRFDAGPDAASFDAGPDASRDAARPDTGLVCQELRVAFSTELPMLILIIDRSGSMSWLFREWTPMFPSASRWEVVRELLVGTDDVVGLVDSTRARIGLSTYAATRMGCPDVRWVPPAYRNAPAIRTEMNSVGPGGGTPTADAIWDALARVPMHREGTEPVAFLLATDGDPNGCGGDALANTVRATADAYAAGVRTFVVSVGDDTSETHMQDVANAGAGLGPGEGDATYWRGRSPTHLSVALEEAAARAVSCIGTLSSPIVDMSRRCEIEVTLGGEPYTCDDLTDGFRFPDPEHIEFHGAACDALREALPLELDAPCGVI